MCEIGSLLSTIQLSDRTVRVSGFSFPENLGSMRPGIGPSPDKNDELRLQRFPLRDADPDDVFRSATRLCQHEGVPATRTAVPAQQKAGHHAGDGGVRKAEQKEEAAARGLRSAGHGMQGKFCVSFSVRLCGM